MENIANFFGDYLFLAVILLAIIPTLEGRVALPFALSFGLHPAIAFLCAFLGSILPAYPAILLTRKLKNRYLTGFLQDRYSSKINKLSLSQSNMKKLSLLFGFVAIPLPMTGVWTGSIIAGLTNLKPWQSFLSISLGGLVACGIILAVCLLFHGSELIIFFISLGLLAIFILIELISMIIKRRKKQIAKS